MSLELFDLPASTEEEQMLLTAACAGFPGYDLEQLRDDRDRIELEPGNARLRLLLRALAVGDTHRVWTLMKAVHHDHIDQLATLAMTAGEK